ncbi:hypothetical protein L1887_36595 [Cichorium endivia]|nr:hypothetical protein L1887_36595 [Cichorium endivia]
MQGVKCRNHLLEVNLARFSREEGGRRENQVHVATSYIPPPRSDEPKHGGNYRSKAPTAPRLSRWRSFAEVVSERNSNPRSSSHYPPIQLSSDTSMKQWICETALIGEAHSLDHIVTFHGDEEDREEGEIQDDDREVDESQRTMDGEIPASDENMEGEKTPIIEDDEIPLENKNNNCEAAQVTVAMGLGFMGSAIKRRRVDLDECNFLPVRTLSFDGDQDGNSKPHDEGTSGSMDLNCTPRNYSQSSGINCSE